MVVQGGAAGPPARRLRLRVDANPPHEQGAGLAAFRSEWGESACRRRQVHEQGLAACGGLGDGAVGKWLPFPKKGFSRDESLERVAGRARRSPRGRLRENRGRGGAGTTGFCGHGKGRKGSAAGLARMPRMFAQKARAVNAAPPVPRRACKPFLMGKAPRLSVLSRDTSKIRRANSEAPLPRRGKQRRIRTLAAPPCSKGQGSVAQRPPLQTAVPCSWACRRLLPLPLHPNRNAARPPPARGAGARLHGAEGAGRRPCRPSYCFYLTEIDIRIVWMLEKGERRGKRHAGAGKAEKRRQNRRHAPSPPRPRRREVSEVYLAMDADLFIARQVREGLRKGGRCALSKRAP